MRHLAIYDMDRTITRRPTWTRFLIHAARRTAPWRLALLPIAGLAALGHPLRLIDRGRLKQVTQRLLIGRTLAPEAAARLAESFLPDVFAAARERIAADRARGYTLVLATASHRYYAQAIAQRLGFDAVVATEAKRGSDGHLLPFIDGENCYGAAKLRQVQAWLASQGLAREDLHVRAYSDHVSDAPLLEWADEPFAVNAHRALAALARARGWTLLDWRG